jgi:hypothetical protein
MRSTEVTAVLVALADEAAMMSLSNGDYQEDPGLRSDLLEADDNAKVAGKALVAAAGRMRASVAGGLAPREPEDVQRLAAEDWEVPAVSGWSIEDALEYAAHNLQTEWSQG